MNPFGMIQLGLMAAQAVMGLVHNAESTGAPGPKKKDLVKSLAKTGVITAITAVTGVPPSEESLGHLGGLLDSTVDNVVSFYNDIGIFSHTKQVVLPPPAPPDPTKTQAFQELATGPAPSVEVQSSAKS